MFTWEGGGGKRIIAGNKTNLQVMARIINIVLEIYKKVMISRDRWC